MGDKKRCARNRWKHWRWRGEGDKKKRQKYYYRWFIYDKLLAWFIFRTLASADIQYSQSVLKGLYERISLYESSYVKVEKQDLSKFHGFSIKACRPWTLLPKKTKTNRFDVFVKYLN